MKSKSLDILSKAFAVLCGFYLLVYLYFYLTGSLFYFGEAISYEGLMRTLHGMPFASGPEEIPLSLTPYTPFFLVPLMGIGKLLSITQIETVTMVARLFQMGLLATLFWVLNNMRKRYFAEISSGWSFFWVLLPVFFYSPVMEMGLRPDTMSFLFEALSVCTILYFLQRLEKKYVFYAATLAGIAVATKLNTLGAAVGIMVFCYFFLDLEKYSFFAAPMVGTAIIVLSLQYQVIGEALPDNIFTSIQSSILSLGEGVKVYSKFFDLFLFPFSYYLFLMLLGLASFPAKKEKKLFVLVLFFSFLFAYLGQMKWGAFHNYFLGFIYLGLIPASIGFKQLTENKTQAQTTGIFLFHFLYISLLIARGTSGPVKIWQDRKYFAELKQIRELIDQKAPQGYIYTNDEKLSLAFAHRTAIGVLSQELLQVTPKLQKRIPALQKKLESLPPYSAYIFKCKALDGGAVGDLFVNLEDVKKRTRIQTGEYCLLY